jgi:hypothetical protein
MGRSGTVVDARGQRGAITIAEAARRLGVARSTLYGYKTRAEKAGIVGRIPYTVGDETVDLILVRGPFAQWYVTNASLDAVLG